MRRVRYGVAVSLDGFIAGPNGEIDWILMDPEIDFGALFAEARDTFAADDVVQLFGVLEAMSRGCPVLASDISVLREVGAAAGDDGGCVAVGFLDETAAALRATGAGA